MVQGCDYTVQAVTVTQYPCVISVRKYTRKVRRVPRNSHKKYNLQRTTLIKNVFFYILKLENHETSTDRT
jgi:hypothetical protein